MSDQASEPVFTQYLCYISSAPGMWAQYEGYIEVYAPKDEEDSDILHVPYGNWHEPAFQTGLVFQAGSF